MPLKHPIRCLSAGFNHARSRPVAQEIRASPSCSAASGRRHRDEGGSRDDPSGRVSATRLMAPVPGVTREVAERGYDGFDLLTRRWCAGVLPHPEAAPARVCAGGVAAAG